jgi:predicted Rossmann-fold nucleotide-binding protein
MTPESRARTVTIMGSSQSPEQIRAFILLAGRVAYELVKRGYNILTGCGKDGIMGAAYDAAVEAIRTLMQSGAKTGENLAIVVTPAWRDENLKDARAIGIADSEPARVDKFHQASDTFIIFPGGAYTLPEATILVGKNRYSSPERRKRIILVGREWFTGLQIQYQKLYADGTLGKNKDGTPITPEQLFIVVDTFEEILAAMPDSANLAEAAAKARAVSNSTDSGAPEPEKSAEGMAFPPETVILYPDGEESMQRALELIALNRYQLHGPRKRLILFGKEFFEGLRIQYRKLFEDGTLGIDPDELFQIVDSKEDILKNLPE